MNNSMKKFVLTTCAVAGIFGLTGCGHKTDQSKTSFESAEFFKEIGTAEQENAEMITNIQMQNGALTSNLPSEVSADSALLPEKPNIQDIQQALKNANIYSGKIDGVSGSQTKGAIESFQEQNDLKVDGKVGPKTWQKLKVYWNASTTSSEAVTPALETTSESSSEAISD